MGVVTTTIFASIAGTRERLSLRAGRLGWEPWRLFTHNFFFTTPGELLFGIILLYFFRQTERQIGSSRYFAFLTAAAAIHTAFILLMDFALPAAFPASPGPYALLGAQLVWYFFETPRIYDFTLLHSVSLSDKSFPYLLAFQLLLSGLPRSSLSFMSGLVCGLFLRFPALAAHLDTPSSVASFAARHILPWMDTAPRPRPTRRRRTGGGSAGVGERGTRRASPNATPALPVADEAHVAALTAMGFSREQAVAALVQESNDVQRATERLLST